MGADGSCFNLLPSVGRRTRRCTVCVGWFLLAATLLASCSPSAAGNGAVAEDRTDSPPPTPNHLKILNEHGHDVTVFAVLTDVEVRLGRVGAASPRTLPLPDRIEGRAMQLSVRCLADDARVRLRPVTWMRGQAVELAIGAELRHSTARVQ